MSHVATIEVKVSDKEALAAAAERLGGVFHEGQKTYRWYGTFVGDSPMPAGMTMADLGKCDHAISFPQASYEVGVRKNEDGSYTLAWDYWGQGGLAPILGGPQAPKLVQAYAAEKLKQEARRLGHAVESETTLQDGTVRLRLLAAR